jgi:hypothetical protein
VESEDEGVVMVGMRESRITREGIVGDHVDVDCEVSLRVQLLQDGAVHVFCVVGTSVGDGW